MHSAGSTDVLAGVVAEPRPTAGLLCRPLGTGGLWVLAATQAAGAAGLAWARRILFPELGDADFDAAVMMASSRATGVVFRPHLAGDRQQVDQPAGGFDGLTLATSREDLLAAAVQSLMAEHADRLRRLMGVVGMVSPTIVTTGGGGSLPELLRATWPDAWASREVDQATLRGLGRLWKG